MRESLLNVRAHLSDDQTPQLASTRHCHPVRRSRRGDPDYPDRDKPDIDLYALMSGKCSTLNTAGRGFACKTVAYFRGEKGRASFTVALDDPIDQSHIVSFSGEYGHRTQDDLLLSRRRPGWS